YGDPLSDPQADPLPEGLLARYADRGITGVWLPVTLHRLCPIPGAGPELSDGWDRRLIQLRALAERTRRHGIGLYLYLNEPRGLSAAGFRGLESWKGVEEKKTGNFAFCTSNPETLEYVKAACSRVFKAAPALAGAFTISMSENLTHCHSRWNGSGCPRCANRPVPEVVAEVNRHIEEGIHAVAPDARVIVWTWAWDPAWAPGAVDLLPDSVDLMCVSEWGKKLSIGGVANRVVDYSISQPGPSEETVALWEHAARRGLRTLAKVQFNTCWECSAVPYIPVPYLVQEHLDGLRSSGVSGLLLSWTLGGYPGGNLDLLETTPEELSRRLYGSVAPDVQQAWRTFGEAFREFPFQVEVLYNSPHNLGPANLLFAEPTGYASSLVGFPYDDLSHWRGAYPEDLFESQFRKVSEGWAEGLDGLRRAEPRVESRHESEFQALMRIATAVYSHFRSAYLQIRFIRLRADPSAEARDAIRKVLEEERQLARTLAHAAAQDSTLGFEATNHYAYTQNDLKEKVLNCCYLLESLKKGTPS
ncbi:MAG: hypothetical protein U1E27_08620, partial [Kiritimatiellia bacterium]|nr:hypothetical protein [Kiritimatiellia bacterium]